MYDGSADRDCCGVNVVDAVKETDNECNSDGVGSVRDGVALW